MVTDAGTSTRGLRAAKVAAGSNNTEGGCGAGRTVARFKAWQYNTRDWQRRAMQMCKSRKVILLWALASPALWAGRQYPAQPGETTLANEILIRLKPGVTASSVISGFLANATTETVRLPNVYLVKTPNAIANGIMLMMAAHPMVEFVEPNRVRRAIVNAPNDPDYVNSSGGQWGLFTAQAQQAWNFLNLPYLTASTAGTNRVRVAVIDTGADCTHPDFMNAGGSSTDVAFGGQLLWSASQALVPTSVSSPACPWQDDYGHGTHVTGIVAAATSNGIGVASLGYPLEVIEYKALDVTGSGSDSTIANAIVEAVLAGAQVISMSLGGSGYSQTLQTAINFAWEENVVVVAAAGNSASNSLFFPADANHAVAVSASDINNNLASFSNFGNAITLSAPGVNILSTFPTYDVTLGCCNYAFLSGTSMATPFVSALAGLVATTSPNTSGTAIVERMEQTASTTAGAWSPSFGYGILNAYNALAGVAGPGTTGGVVGQVMDPSQNGLSGAQVTINGQTYTTGSSGLFWFRGLTAGIYGVSVSALGYSTQSLSVTVPVEADADLTVVMGTAYGSITGTVTDQGVAMAGATVEALTSGLIVAAAETGANGQYTLWVPGGSTYSLEASAIGSKTANGPAVSVAAGTSTNVNLTIPSLYGGIAGVMQDVHGNPIAGGQVTAASGSYSGSGSSGADGSYSITLLPPGTYTVTASASGYGNATQTGINVAADTTTTVNIQLLPPAAGAPQFNPTVGTYASAVTVSLSSSTSGASIRYTTDSSTPSETIGTPYTGPFTIAATTTVKAIAYASGQPDSAISTATYVINSNSWYSTGGTWNSRKMLTINHGQVAGNLTNFPVLISVTDSDLAAGAQASGNDILFTAADGLTKLNHDLPVYVSATGQMVAWVNVPSLSSTADTVIYLYYGNGSAGAQANVPGTWPGYQGVWHLSESSVGNGATLHDSTGNGNNATISGTHLTLVSGGIYQGVENTVVQGGDRANLASSIAWGNTAFSYSYWVQAGTATALSSVGGSGSPGSNYVGVYGGNGSLYTDIDGATTPATSLGTFTAGTWYQIFVTVSAPSGGEQHDQRVQERERIGKCDARE